MFDYTVSNTGSGELTHDAHEMTTELKVADSAKKRNVDPWNKDKVKPAVRHNVVYVDGIKTSSDGPVPAYLSVGGGVDSESGLKREASSTPIELMPSPKQHKGMYFCIPTTCTMFCVYCPNW